MRALSHLHLTDAAWFLTTGHLPLWADWYVHPPAGLEPHDHDYLEIGIVIKGTARHRWAGGEEDIAPGSVIVIEPGVCHGFGPSPFLVMFNCCIAEHLLQGDLAWLMQDTVLKYVLRDGLMADGRGGVLRTTIGEDAIARLDPQLVHLNTALKMRDQSTWLEKAAAIASAMAAFAGAIRAADSHAASLGIGPDRHPAIRQILAILDADLTREWTVPQLADRVYLERSYLTRLFHSQVGMPPLAYQTRLRVQRAADLLLKSDESVQRIGVMVGWDEPSYFARRFRDFFGVSPREYRTALKRDPAPAAK